MNPCAGAATSSPGKSGRPLPERDRPAGEEYIFVDNPNGVWY
jgi:hypothetical protein